ncbi:hypothetical protein [Eubacterium sp.]|uniref:hypothetical protein n=1 Tax=Eubacterium sp. TaxID=142586 RepID=UPI0025DC4241|nr:hypothetical protein [Eubacterium sp.]MCR5628722.1 hypothetical protein [Eubacterium sp.]
MIRKRLYAGMAFAAIGLLGLNSNSVNASDLKGKMTITNEGKYVIEDYKDNNTFDKKSVYEVEFKPEKTGVYNLTSSIGGNNKKIYMGLSTDDYEFSHVYGETEGDKIASATKDVYLEKGLSYYVWVYCADNNDKSFDFDVKFLNEEKFSPKVIANLYKSEDEKIAFADVKQKGFDWNAETNTLTLDNCKLKGSINIDNDKSKFDYDSNKFRSVFTINVKGNSSINNKGAKNYVIGIGNENYSADEEHVDVVIKGEGKKKSNLKFNNKISYISLCFWNPEENFDEYMFFDADLSNLTIKNVTINAKNCRMIADKLSVKNSKIELTEEYEFHRGGTDEDDNFYRKDTFIYNPAFLNNSTYISNKSIVNVKLKSLPKKYLGKKYKNTDVRVNIFKHIDKIKNSKVTVKVNKKLVNSIKKGKVGTIYYIDKKQKKLLKKIKYKKLK